MNNTPDNNRPQNRPPQQNPYPPQNRPAQYNGQQQMRPQNPGPRPQNPGQRPPQAQGMGQRPQNPNMGQPPRIPPNLTPEQREAYMRRLAAQRAAQGQAPQGQKGPRFRKKKKAKPNVGLILFIVLILGVVGVSMYQISKNGIPGKESESKAPAQNEVQAESGETDSMETNAPAESDPAVIPQGPEVNPPVTTPLALYDSVYINSGDVNLGNLILVNYDHAWSLADTVETVNVYENKTSNFSVSTTAHELTSSALNALNNLADAFTADTGLREILMVSSYRTTADQQTVYDNKAAQNGADYAAAYVAQPGYSEHHTGMATDLSFYRHSDGASIPVSDHDYGWWLTEHCAEYGYILRYPDDKVEITKISYEPWHFRYVGKPHAAAIMANGLCLEEYLDKVHDYTLDEKMMHVTPEGACTDINPEELPATGYLVYFIPADTNNEETEIKIPKGKENYIVSGNNSDGFIVTVYLG